MSGRIPIGRAITMIVGVTAIGYGFLALTTPTEQQFYDSLSPDLKKKVDDNRAFRKMESERKEQLDMFKASAEAETPVWSSALPDKSKTKR